MDTDTLIDELTRDVPPVSPHSMKWRLLVGILSGGVITLLLVAATLGFRHDLGLAMHGFAFWMKWSYTISLGVGAIVMMSRLGRPEPVRLARYWPAVLPFLILAALSIGEMMHTPPADWLAMWLSHSWKVCPWLVLALSAPIFIGLLWSFRRLAPTRLRAAGAAAGLAAGAWSATVYCLHCPEVSALFVLTWYSLGILLAAGVGAMVGPKLMRW